WSTASSGCRASTRARSMWSIPSRCEGLPVVPAARGPSSCCPRSGTRGCRIRRETPSGACRFASVELTDYRDRFPILESTTYLINHSLGAMPAEAERRLAQFAGEWRTRGARAWGEGWWDTVYRVGDLVGAIVGAPPGTTVMHQNVTVAEAIVLSCFDIRPPRNRIVFEEGLFPSVRYVQQAWS